MKKIFLVVLASITLSACSDTKNEEKAALDSVIKIHDKVMGNDELLMQNKMKLDTLLKTATDTTQKAQIQALTTKLTSADGSMEKWMEKFDPEQKGKSHAEIMAYFTAQKTQVMQVDSELSDAVKQSGLYISQHKK